MIEQQYQHCIFVCSNYTAGTRNGLHFLFNDTNYNEIKNLVSKYVSKEGVSVYFIVTNDYSIESVKQKDRFFKNINILEGTEHSSIIQFNNSINNQINVMDIALLLLSREQLSSWQLKTYLFYIYCLYAEQYNSFPFKEKCYFDKTMIGFKMINGEFDKYDKETSFSCTKPTIIMSKFFNTDKGVELMNKVLEKFYYLKQFDVADLAKKIDIYFQKCCALYKLNSKRNRYRFTLTKKSINHLKISVED